MRTVILILTLLGSLSWTTLHAQKDPPSSPPPPPKSSNYDNSKMDDLKREEEYRKKMMEAEKERLKKMDEAKKKSMEKEKASNTGFRSLRIATFGNYQLGMMKSEYDSLMKLGGLIIKADNDSYPVTLKPTFTGERLTSLIMESKPGTRLDGFARMIALEYREPDSVNTSHFNDNPANLKDSTKWNYQNITISEFLWKNKLHNMIIYSQSEILENGTYWGKFTIKFQGNKDYLDLLKSLDKLGD